MLKSLKDVKYDLTEYDKAELKTIEDATTALWDQVKIEEKKTKELKAQLELRKKQKTDFDTVLSGNKYHVADESKDKILEDKKIATAYGTLDQLSNLGPLMEN